MAHNFTEEQVKEAIDNSDLTSSSVARYLALHFSRNGKCKGQTADRYIKEYNLDTRLKDKIASVSNKALKVIIEAIEKGDRKTAKWWLERIMRQMFGNEITVHNENKDPLNINFENFNVKELLDSDSEIGGLN